MTIYEMAQKYYPRLIDGFEWFEPLPDEKKNSICTMDYSEKMEN